MKKLFNEFPPVTTKEWELLINNDLKGGDYQKKLIWKSIENLKFKPYYREEDTKDLEHLNTKSEQFPFVTTNKTDDNKWQVCQSINTTDVKQANIYAKEIISRGVTSVEFIIPEKFNITQTLFSELLSEIDIAKIEINFTTNSDAEKLINLFANYIKNQGINSKDVKGSISFSPISYFSLNGEFNIPENRLPANISNILKLTKKKLPGFKTILINAESIANSGATSVQQLACALSMAAEYISFATDNNIAIEDITPYLKFSFGIGASYFVEIAKFRAFRYLFAKFIKAYNPKDDKTAKTYVHASTIDCNKTLYDAHVNMLRTTTEAMSAIIGGIDSLTVQPFDKVSNSANEFSERIARNQQIILKEESFLDKVIDVGAGSYYIENITASLIQASWDLFVEIENQGGYIKAFKNNFIQNLIKATNQKRSILVATGRQTILGTNKYPNEQENLLKSGNNIQNINTPDEINGIYILKPYRVAEMFENLRMQTEKCEKTPNVFLFTYGNKTMRKARADFAGNFFAIASFKITNNIGFETIQAGITECKKQDASIVVLCSADDAYEDMAKEIIAGLDDKILIIAGAPKNTEGLKKLGIKHFINIKSNIFEELTYFQKELGI